jgi:hypothetical protein
MSHVREIENWANLKFLNTWNFTWNFCRHLLRIKISCTTPPPPPPHTHNVTPSTPTEPTTHPLTHPPTHPPIHPPHTWAWPQDRALAPSPFDTHATNFSTNSSPVSLAYDLLWTRFFRIFPLLFCGCGVVAAALWVVYSGSTGAAAAAPVSLVVYN